MTDSELIGVVLAGGESKRMGQDKSLLDFNGMPLREYLHQMLGRYCAKVFLSCKNAAEVPVNLNPVEDAYQISSPLNGILSTFSKTHRCALIAVAVDMPLVDDDVIQFLISNRATHKLATCFWDSDGKRPEPMLCIWEYGSFALLKDFALNGSKSPREFLENHDVNILNPPDPSKLVSINTPEQYARLPR